ncbi:hypothetical protein [Arcanobacterium canis]
MDWTPILTALAGTGIASFFSFLGVAITQRRKKNGARQTENDRARQRAARVEAYAYTLYQHLLALAVKHGEDISSIPPPPPPEEFTPTTSPSQ